MDICIEDKKQFLSDLIFIKSVINDLIGIEEMELLFAYYNELKNLALESGITVEKDSYFENAFKLQQDENDQWKCYMLKFLYHNQLLIMNIFNIMQIKV